MQRLSAWPLTRTLLGLMGALLASALAAQPIYRIVGADGRVTYADSPAAAVGRTTVTEAGRVAAGDGASQLPPALRQLALQHSVTLYTTNACAPCTAGRAMLVGRGIPFTEKTITSAEDSEALLGLSGETTLPLLAVGAQRLKGWSLLQWQAALDTAGYPARSQLPASYRWPAATPLAGAAEAQARTGAATGPALPPLPPAPPVTAPATGKPNPASITF